MRKSLYFFSMFVLALGMGLMMFIMYSLFWPFKVAEYFNEPFPVLNENRTLRAGDVLKYEVDFCKYKPLPTHITRELKGDTRVVTLTAINSNFPAECKVVAVERLKITPDISPGEYELVLSFSWDVNALRTVTTVVKTEKFIIE